MGESITIANLVARLGVEIDEHEWKHADSIIGKAKVAIAGFLGFEVIKELGEVIHSTVEFGDNLIKMSQKTGISTDALQTWGFAAKMADIDTETLSLSLGKFSKGLIEAAETGKGPVVDGFRQIGLSMNDPAVKAKNLDEILIELGDKFRKMPDGPKKTAAAMNLFGRAGAQLIPLLNEGGDGLRELKKEAEELGLVFKREDLDQLAKFDDESKKAGAIWDNLKKRFAIAALPVLQDVLTSVLEFFVENKEDIQEFFTTLGRGIGYVVKALAWIVTHVAPIVKAIGVAIGQLIGWIVVHVQKIPQAFMDAWNFVKSSASAVWDFLVGIGRAIVDTFIDVGHAIVDAFRFAFNWIIDKAKAVASAIGDLPIIKQLGDAGRFIGGKLATAPTSAFETAKATGSIGEDVTEAQFNAQRSANVANQRESARVQQEAAGNVPIAPPTFSPAGGTYMSVGDVTTTVQVTPGPGMDEKQLADKVGDVVDQRMSETFRSARAGKQGGAP